MRQAYAFVVEPKGGPLNALEVLQSVQPSYPIVTAATVATHTYPWIIVVYVDGELTPGERDGVQAVLDAMDPE